MQPRIVYRDEVGTRRGLADAQTATCLVDLGLPCPLACPVCWRGQRTAPGGLASARAQLLAAAEAAPARDLRAVLYGGDPFAVPHAVSALLADASAACEEHGRAFDALVVSGGVGWSGRSVRDLARYGARLVQVTLEGRRELHDRLRPLAAGGGSFDPILASLAAHRSALPVVVRMNALRGDAEIDALAEVLERAGLFAPPGPVLLYVAPPAPYREQVLDLLALAEWAHPPLARASA